MQRRVVGQGRGQWFPAGQGGFELSAFRGDFGIAEGESPSVQVVAPFAGLSSLWAVGRGGLVVGEGMVGEEGVGGA